MTLREIIYGFKDFVGDSTHRISDDSGWSNRLLKHHFDIARAELIYQKRQRKPETITRHNEQTLPCVTLTRIDMNECPCLPASGCMFLKSTHPIPTPVNDLIISVTSVTGNVRFDPLKWSNFYSKINSRIPAEGRAKYYTFKDIGEGVYLYVYNDQFMEAVSVTGIFEDPLDVRRFPVCDKEPDPICSPLDEEYVIDKDLIMPMYRSALQMVAGFKRISAPDNLNNDQDDTSGSKIPTI